MARRIVFILGLVIAIVPYLGFPEWLDTILYMVGGLLIAVLAWSGQRKSFPPPSSAPVEIAHREQIVPEKREEIASPEIISTPAQKDVPVAFEKRKTRSLKARVKNDEVM